MAFSCIANDQIEIDSPNENLIVIHLSCDTFDAVLIGSCARQF